MVRTLLLKKGAEIALAMRGEDPRMLIGEGGEWLRVGIRVMPAGLHELIIADGDDELVADVERVVWVRTVVRYDMGGVFVTLTSQVPADAISDLMTVLYWRVHTNHGAYTAFADASVMAPGVCYHRQHYNGDWVIVASSPARDMALVDEDLLVFSVLKSDGIALFAKGRDVFVSVARVTAPAVTARLVTVPGYIAYMEDGPYGRRVHLHHALTGEFRTFISLKHGEFPVIHRDHMEVLSMVNGRAVRRSVDLPSVLLRK